MEINIVDTIVIYTLVNLIIFSYLGYGILSFKLLNLNYRNSNLGYIGISGCFLLILLSYITIFFVPHNSIHNIIIIILGILIFLKNYKSINPKYLKLLLLFIIVTFSFFLISKTHDDFPYYHLPFSLNLSENKIQFGLGNLNLAFRHHSSILFLNSLKYLPDLKFYLFNLPNYLIYIFVNIVLIDEIIKKNNTNYIKIFSLFFLTLINIKFTRLAEYGTDLAGQLILIILFLNIIKFLLSEKIDSENLILTSFILILLTSFKVYFILYFSIFFILIYFIKKKDLEIFKIFNVKICVYFLSFLFLISLHNFISTGCLIYPVSKLCVGSYYDWSLAINEVERLANWLDLWSKAGAAPNYKVDNIENYLSGFNWVENWIDKYFFNKVSDYLLVLFFTSLLVLFFFKNQFSKSIKLKTKYFYISLFISAFSLLFILFWFTNHPSLRYGGYIPIAIFVFSLISYFISDSDLPKNSNRNAKILIILVLLVFNIKNLNRIYSEFNRIDQYQFNSFPYFFVKEKEYSPQYYNNEVYLNVAEKYCWSVPSPCSNTIYEIKKKNGFIFFNR